VRALVTGGMSGIGAAVVTLLRSAGHDVVAWDVAAGAASVVDISNPDQVEAAMAELLASGPAPDLVAACAGVGHSGMLLEESPADWDRVLGVNLTGAWLTVRAAASAMVAAGTGGSIVVVSSISGTVADRNMAAYCVSKAGVDMLVKVAAVELGVHGIRVNAVGPGVTRTPMLAKPEALPGWVDGLSERTPLGRLGEADDVAKAVVAVLGMEWVTGQIIHADGGLSLHSPIDAYGQSQRVIRTPRS
jgi:NAD(P)-dependent dehydrogenase (short-subunit alcohol dehydrogenase family)